MPAVWMSALLGTQPVQVQSPPIRSFSTSTTFAPTALAKGAATSPAEPAPIITRSYSASICPILPRQESQGR